MKIELRRVTSIAKIDPVRLLCMATRVLEKSLETSDESRGYMWDKDTPRLLNLIHGPRRESRILERKVI